MTLKTKLLATISMVAVTIALLMVGVWAVKTANFSVGGNISFTATGINATISAGALNDASAWKTASDANEKLKAIVMNTDKTQSQIESEFASWSGLDFVFNEAGEDVTITFTITNTSTVPNDYISIHVVPNSGTAVNATISANATFIPLAPNESKQVVLTFRVTDKTANASLTGFNIEFLMEQAKPVDSTTTPFEFSTSGKYATITSVSPASSDIVVPEFVNIEGTVYIVDGFGYNYYPDEGVTVSVLAEVSGITNVSFESVYAFSQSSFRHAVIDKVEILKGSVVSLPDDEYGGFTELHLPETLVELEGSLYSLSHLIFNSENPPKLASITMTFLKNNVQIQVPASSVEAYKTAWPDLASKISAISE